MSDNSHIQWTDATWPITTGCTEAGPDCLHCYARQHSWRLAHNPNRKVAQAYQNVTTKTSNGRVQWTGTLNCLAERLDWPLKWKQPRRIFVANMSDLFHEDVPFSFIDQVFAVIFLCPQHTFQVLTKRPKRMMEYFTPESASRVSRIAHSLVVDGKAGDRRQDFATSVNYFWPLSHVWIGTSVGTQKAAAERIPLLQKVPAAVRFLSCEPLLEQVYLGQYLTSPNLDWIHAWEKELKSDLNGVRYLPLPSGAGIPVEKNIHWVIVGGESGHNARPCSLDWIHEIVQQCRDAGIAVYIKQLGTAWAKQSGNRMDSKGGNPEVWPADLRVREFPTFGYPG